jgi:hypothetical protein
LDFCNYLPFEEDLALYFKNLKLPLPKDDLYQVSLKLICWFWRGFLKIFSVFLLFCYYLPLDKGIPLHLNNLESPPLRMICAKSGLNWSCGSGEEVENVKVYRQTDRQIMDNRRSEKLT